MATGDIMTGSSLPAGITLPAGALLEDVKRNDSPQNEEQSDLDGKFNRGKTIKTKTSFVLTGTISGSITATLQALEGTGTGAVGTPRIEKVDIEEINDKAHKFTINAWQFDNTQSDYGL